MLFRGRIFGERDSALRERSPQRASLLIERLETSPDVLDEEWSRRYPRDELERVAVAWGKPLH